MQREILAETSFDGPAGGWEWPKKAPAWLQVTPEGSLLSPERGERATLSGAGVHTRNGDAIEFVFESKDSETGVLLFGFSGGAEHATVELDFAIGRVRLSTSDWTVPQPVAEKGFKVDGTGVHRVLIEKMEGAGGLIKRAEIGVYVDGHEILRASDLNILPEIGVTVSVEDTSVLLRHFAHLGTPSGIPEHLHVGAWQMLNESSIENNLASIKRGLRQAGEAGVQLLVTPETSLTGLYPEEDVTQNPGPVSEAEADLRRFMAGLANAPYLVVGLPAWEPVPEHARALTRYNLCRVYDPDGGVASSHAKIHSCETEFWHGYRLHEFDVYGVPVTMHICHDGRYPEVWTLPVMFGARLILHPSNPVDKADYRETVDRFECRAKASTTTSHAFYLQVSGAGGSFIAGPQKHNNLLAVSPECRRDNEDFPLCGKVTEGLVHSRIRIHDAFGYWPVRSFRASEEIARAYRALYKAWGGKR